MNRRSFLKFLGSAGAAAIVAPKVSYFFAPQGGWTQGKGGLWAMNCPPRCPEHLHLWQVQEAMERMDESDAIFANFDHIDVGLAQIRNNQPPTDVHQERTLKGLLIFASETEHTSAVISRIKRRQASFREMPLNFYPGAMA